MTRMMETLESRQMFSVTGVDAAALPSDTSTTTATTGDIVVTKPADKSSPKLYQACSNGQHYPTVTVTL